MLKWVSRRADPPQAAPPAPSSGGDSDVKTNVFPRFLTAVAHQAAPVLLDVGPVVGSNVSWFGERLGCKMHIEDLYADVETFAKRGDRAALAEFFATRLDRIEPGTVDGILVWDLFDFLDRPSGQVLAGKLAALLRKGGALYGTFGSAPADLKSYTKVIVQGDSVLKYRPVPATPVARTVLLTRDIIKMFDGLIMSDSVLLKSGTRETLFRRP